MKWFVVLCLPLFSASQKLDTAKHAYTYLALGDSYTLGQGLPQYKNFPFQTVALLREKGYNVMPPEIIAKTGWTTNELQDSIKNYPFAAKYDFVSLLIGVNNQYRGKNINQYKKEFEQLVKKSIELAGGSADNVIVISIPDYAATPFGQQLDVKRIAKQIDEYNRINRAISLQYKTQYVEITQDLRRAQNTAGLVAWDGLHPSAKQYANWAKKITAFMKAE